MPTVQLAIRNRRYAAALAELLERDGSHKVVLVEAPDLKVDGIIALDGDKTENLLLFEAQPERFVVITRKDAGLLAQVWDAGVRHVVFEEDSPSLAMLAVIAAELRGASTVKKPPSLSGHTQKRLLREFPVPILETQTAHYRTCCSKFCKML
jgi:hypothetical protein